MELQYQIFSARKNLIKCVEAQGLPPTVMKYILKEVLDMTCALSDREAFQCEIMENTKVEVKENDNTNDQS